MTIGLEGELGPHGEIRFVSLKMFPQDFDILKLGLAILLRDREEEERAAGTSVRKKKNSEEYFMSSFYELVEQIIKQEAPTPKAAAVTDDDADNEDDGDEGDDELMIKVEFDEFAGVEAITMPTEAEDEILEQELKRGRDFDEILQTWMQKSHMRKRIRLVSPGSA